MNKSNARTILKEYIQTLLVHELHAIPTESPNTSKAIVGLIYTDEILKYITYFNTIATFFTF